MYEKRTRFEMIGKGSRGRGSGWGKLSGKVCSSISLLVVMGLSFVSGCPSDCGCKWKGGKQTVECVNRGLRTFPHNIDPGTQVLDISGNKFETLPPDHFMRSGLINLQKIYLSRCQLSHINSRAFRGLSNLVDLDLSQNVLGEVPSPAFPDCQGLMKLILSGNPIRSLPKKAFITLQSLTTLELSHCEIDRIEKGAFEGLLSLEWLKLNGNRLKRISGLASLPTALKGVYFEENPWECDCRLLELRVWLAERNVANSVEPRCSGPDRLANATLKDVTEENFACAPELSPTTMYQKIGEGKNVSLLCKVSSIPESSVEWWFNGQPVSNSSLNMVVDTISGGNLLGNVPLNARGASPSALSSLPGSFPQGGGIEKKSELLILNATADENGTFVCVARNPAGTSMANFTLRVLTKYEVELPTSLGGIPNFVVNYPNLMIILVSTLAVIVLVILLVCFFFLLCKCSRLCRRKRRGESAPGSTRRGKDSNPATNGKHAKSESKDGTMGSVVSGGKMDRHLSETSTLTTHTKSNGSVFLLSTSSELGDSNPDLIEGVKRVEGDGLETSFSHFNGTMYCSNGGEGEGATSSGYLQQPPPHYATLGHCPSSNLSSPSAVILEPGGQFPVDYGLPKGLNVATLVRRSPSFPAGTLPSNYDLAKYPKEYISPQQSSYSTYGPVPQQVVFPHGAPPPNSQDFFPAYILPPGAYVTTFSAPGGEEYTVAMGSYMDGIPPPINCSCAPILEGTEPPEEKGESSGVSPRNSPSIVVTSSQMTQTGTSPVSPEGPVKAETGGESKGSTGTGGASNKNGKQGTLSSSNKPSSSSNGRLQRQLTTQVNESPDEGYEDESAEGTEI